MAEILETLMLILFGISWPVNGEGDESFVPFPDLGRLYRRDPVQIPESRVYGFTQHEMVRACGLYFQFCYALPESDRVLPEQAAGSKIKNRGRKQ